MTIPFQAEGQLLPVSPWLKSQLTEMVSEQSINLEPLTALTFRFNDPNLHIPVENEHLFRFKMNADSGLRVHHFRTPQSTNSDVR